MALFPQSFLDCVVAIGMPGANEVRWIGTGFLYGHFRKPVDAEGANYGIYLITNKHVVRDQEKIIIRFNPLEGDRSAQHYPLSLVNNEGKAIWYQHSDEDIDLAVISIRIDLLKQDDIRFWAFQSDQCVASMEQAKSVGITEGDGVYVFGYPMGLIGGDRNYVISRHGTIARIRDAMDNVGKEFLIDSLIFPGNSGGPVVTKPEAFSIKGTPPVKRSYLIGVIRAYLPYKEIAYSLQTEKPEPRAVFMENTGLAAVIPIDYVMDIVQECERQKGLLPSEEVIETETETIPQDQESE